LMYPQVNSFRTIVAKLRMKAFKTKKLVDA
jgi:hypothetical protein